MDTALTIDEIEKRFDGQWVLLEDPITNAALEIKQGKVRFHGKEQDELYRKARELGLQRGRSFSPARCRGRWNTFFEYVPGNLPSSSTICGG